MGRERLCSEPGDLIVSISTDWKEQFFVLS